MIIVTEVLKLRDVFMVGGFVAVMAGFYYSTQARLDLLEGSVQRLIEAESSIVVMEERISNLDHKIDFIYDRALKAKLSTEAPAPVTRPAQ